MQTTSRTLQFIHIKLFISFLVFHVNYKVSYVYSEQYNVDENSLIILIKNYVKLT